MKKLLAAVFAVFLISAWMTFGYAADTVTETDENVSHSFYVKTIAWKADNLSVKADVSTRAIDGMVLMVVTDPGTPAPADNYDIQILDVDGVEVTGSQLGDRDTANSEQAFPYFGTDMVGERLVVGPVTVKFSNIGTADAEGEVKIFYER